MSTEERSSRRIHISTQSVLRSRREVGLLKGRILMVGRSSEPIPLHPPRQSHTMENPTVRESGYVGCFL